ncbi:MAG TPA: AraC family transcriptional regulator, partial [Planctomycetia bacterium]|nr:AraC family transcriptional regulator [Planctomycetia bacterium]
TLAGILRELDPSAADGKGPAFPFAAGPIDRSHFVRHRELVRLLDAATSKTRVRPDRLEIEVRALELVGSTIESAFARHGMPRRSRKGVESAHTERVEAAKEYLAGNLGRAVTLAYVARAAHASPFHLARLFQRRTGLPIHRYLVQLRLRAAVERLAGGERNLASLALNLGFASHSHFTDSFRREFGRTPSSFRSLKRAV